MPALSNLLFWVIAPARLTAIFLCASIVMSAIGVTHSAHATRNMYRDLQVLEKDHDDLEHEYEKLILEQSAWADYTRLDQLAQEKLSMSPPTAAFTVVLK